MYITKLDPLNVLSKLTYNLALNNSELSTIKKTQRNIDIISKSSNDIEELRKKIQIENEEIYGINIIITFYSQDFNQMSNIFSKYRAKLYSKGIGVEITNFRHLEFYLLNLPLNNRNKFLENNLILTTKALANVFPFYTDNIVDVKGIPLGYTKVNRRLCMIDIFSNKYGNSNMCILGASGSGKSYFTKLCILRNYFKDRVQIVLDIEDEYSNLCTSLGGTNIFKNIGFNIFEINHSDLLEEDYLAKKIENITSFLSTVIDIKMEKENIKKEIEKLYEDFGITKDIESVLSHQEDGTISIYNELIEKDRFPTILDLEKKTKYKTLKKKINESLNLTLKPFLLPDRLRFSSKLFILNLRCFRNNEEVIIKILEYINRQLTLEKEVIIYIDELFKYIKYEKVLDIICDMYKSIRKRRGSIITITQDITDFFKYKDGFYANSIINNSNFKVIFKTEFEDSNAMEKVINTKSDLVSSLKKGEAFLVINKSSVHLEVVANSFERLLLNEYDYSSK